MHDLLFANQAALKRDNIVEHSLQAHNQPPSRSPRDSRRNASPLNTPHRVELITWPSSLTVPVPIATNDPMS